MGFDSKKGGRFNMSLKLDDLLKDLNEGKIQRFSIRKKRGGRFKDANWCFEIDNGAGNIEMFYFNNLEEIKNELDG